MDYILEVNDISKSMKKFSLKDINFNLEHGYIMGLIGPNGSGKTTLINTILGLYKADSGNIKICGHDCNIDESKAKGEIGFILDENPFIDDVSAKDNARMYAPYYKNWNMERFNYYCSRFQIDTKTKLKKLSKGTIIKFQLAFALSHDAKLLVMDEPSSGLDPIFRRELVEIMYDEILGGDKSILFSTHLTEEIDMIADYVTMIHRGKLVFSQSKEELFEQYRIIDGNSYNLSLIDPREIVGTRITEHSAQAMVYNGEYLTTQNIHTGVPTIEDIMYYITQSMGR
jgi:ABC-2 type transport system ATP-binding protein